VVIFSGCASNAPSASGPFYRGDLVAARETLRPAARAEKLNENTVLTASQLGMAALADGDTVEARTVLRTAYDILESGNVNDDARIFAATVLWEGVTVYKGEPFEQALALTALAAAYATEGDWQNTRIAARATTRRLREYADARGDSSDIARAAARAEQARNDPDYDYFRDEARFVDTNYTMGYLLQAVAARQLNDSAEADSAARMALAINPSLRPLTDRIVAGRYNTIIHIDVGRGPQKTRYGQDGVFTRWVPVDTSSFSDLRITADRAPVAVPYAAPVTDINAMAQDHRWSTLQDARNAKSLLGNAMLLGGTIVAATSNNRDTQLIGLGIALAGLLTRSTAAADVRHNPFLPAASYFTVADLPPGSDVRIELPELGGAGVVALPNMRAPRDGEPPLYVYLRLAGPSPVRAGPSGTAAQAATVLRHTNDSEPPQPGDYPWILGGRCVATPSRRVLEAYQAGGYLLSMSLDDLSDLYRQEGIHFGSGPPEPGRRLQDDFRHILEGGNALFTPAYGTMGYKRLMYSAHPAYKPRSARVAELASRIGLNQ